jgi:hypothetical protein
MSTLDNPRVYHGVRCDTYNDLDLVLSALDPEEKLVDLMDAISLMTVDAFLPHVVHQHQKLFMFGICPKVSRDDEYKHQAKELISVLSKAKLINDDPDKLAEYALDWTGDICDTSTSFNESEALELYQSTKL